MKMSINNIKVLMTIITSVIIQNLYAQIGGNLTPLQYSTHEYSALKEHPSNNAIWNIYLRADEDGDTDIDADDLTALELKIERGTATPLIVGTDYTKLSPVGADPARAYFRVQFSTSTTTLPVGEYVIGYLETAGNGTYCTTSTVQVITIYGPFDIDVGGDSGAGCPDDSESGDYIQNASTYVFQTQVQFLVNLVYPDAGSGGYDFTTPWRFRFDIAVNGVSGSSAVINSVNITGTGFTEQSYSPGTSTFYQVCTVTNESTTQLVFTLTINDVLGVEQDVDFWISSILGSFREPDIDEAKNLAGNSIDYTIYMMPASGEIFSIN